MFNYRLVVAGLKDDLLALYQYKKSSVSFDDLVSSIQVIDDKFKRVAMWLLLREFSNTEVQDFIEKFTKYNPTINVSKEKLQLGDKIFSDKEDIDELKVEISNYIDREYPVLVSSTVKVEPPKDQVPIAYGDGIKVYLINNAKDAIALAARPVSSWCISQPGNTMWQSYRDTHGATFLFVFDENPPADVLKIVALDFTQKGRAEQTPVLLTDLVNRTGMNLTESVSYRDEDGQIVTGRDWQAYSGYLKSKGVDLEQKIVDPETQEERLLFSNKPLTAEETKVATVFEHVRRKGLSLDTFIEFINSKENLASKWIGRGNALTDEILSYLWDKRKILRPLLEQYVDIDIQRNPSQEMIFTQDVQLAKTYLRKLYQAEIYMLSDFLWNLIKTNPKFSQEFEAFAEKIVNVVIKGRSRYSYVDVRKYFNLFEGTKYQTDIIAYGIEHKLSRQSGYNADSYDFLEPYMSPDNPMYIELIKKVLKDVYPNNFVLQNIGYEAKKEFFESMPEFIDFLIRGQFKETLANIDKSKLSHEQRKKYALLTFDLSKLDPEDISFDLLQTMLLGSRGTHYSEKVSEYIGADSIHGVEIPHAKWSGSRKVDGYSEGGEYRPNLIDVRRLPKEVFDQIMADDETRNILENNNLRNISILPPSYPLKNTSSMILKGINLGHSHWLPKDRNYHPIIPDEVWNDFDALSFIFRNPVLNSKLIKTMLVHYSSKIPRLLDLIGIAIDNFNADADPFIPSHLLMDEKILSYVLDKLKEKSQPYWYSTSFLGHFLRSLFKDDMSTKLREIYIDFIKDTGVDEVIDDWLDVRDEIVREYVKKYKLTGAQIAKIQSKGSEFYLNVFGQENSDVYNPEIYELAAINMFIHNQQFVSQELDPRHALLNKYIDHDAVRAYKFLDTLYYVFVTINQKYKLFNLQKVFFGPLKDIVSLKGDIDRELAQNLINEIERIYGATKSEHHENFSFCITCGDPLRERNGIKICENCERKRINDLYVSSLANQNQDGNPTVEAFKLSLIKIANKMDKNKRYKISDILFKLSLQ